MARTFTGKFAIIRNTKGVVCLRKEDDYTKANGFQFFTAKDAALVLEKFNNAKAKGMEVRIFQPEPDGTEPVILHRGGSPYLALLPKKDTKSRPAVEDISSLL